MKSDKHFKKYTALDTSMKTNL